jgi:hypothetical protein
VVKRFPGQKTADPLTREFRLSVQPIPFLTFPAYEGDETGDKSAVPPGLRIDADLGTLGRRGSLDKEDPGDILRVSRRWLTNRRFESWSDSAKL